VPIDKEIYVGFIKKHKKIYMEKKNLEIRARKYFFYMINHLYFL